MVDQGYRFFCNKLWNAVKFAMLYLGQGFTPDRATLRGLVSRQPAAAAAPASGSFCPVPAASELNSASGLAQLNTILQSSPFLSGEDSSQHRDDPLQSPLAGTKSSSTDIEVFSSISCQPDRFTHPNLSRW